MRLWSYVCKAKTRLRGESFFFNFWKFVYIFQLFFQSFKRNFLLSNTFWLYQHGVRSAYFRVIAIRFDLRHPVKRPFKSARILWASKNDRFAPSWVLSHTNLKHFCVESIDHAKFLATKTFASYLLTSSIKASLVRRHDMLAAEISLQRQTILFLFPYDLQLWPWFYG